MWGKFLKVDKGVQSLTAWATLFGGLVGGFGWLSTKLKVMGDFGWAEAIFVGVGAALVVMLVASACLVAWRYFRPTTTPQRPAVSGETPDIPMLPAHVIEQGNDIKTIWEAVHYLKDKEREHAVELKAADEAWGAVIEMVRAETVNRSSALGALAKDLSGQIGEVIGTASAAAHGELQEAVGAISQRLDELEKRAARTGQRFIALWHRELLEERDGAIQYWIKRLDAFPNDEISTWEKWQSAFIYLKSHLESWREVAAHYEKARADALFSQPAELFKSSNWTRDFSELPSPDAIHDFKSFRIIVENYEKTKPAVRREMDNVIFNAV